MQSTVSLTRRLTGAVAALGAVLLTASCAAGQHAATSEDRPAIDGNTATVRTMDVRGAAVLAPPAGATAYLVGQDAPLTMVLVNNGTSGDTLTSITSSAATGFRVVDGNLAALPSTAAPVPSVITSASASSSGSSSSAGSSSASSSASASPSSSAAVPQAQVQIPAGGRVSFGLPDSAQSMFLTGLRTALYAAQVITVTMTFQNAGSVTFEVPVQLTGSPNSSTIPVPSGDGAAG